MLDYDADLEAVKLGKQAVFEGLEKEVYPSSDAVKIDFARKLVNQGEGSFGWALGKLDIKGQLIRQKETLISTKFINLHSGHLQ